MLFHQLFEAINQEKLKFAEVAHDILIIDGITNADMRFKHDTSIDSVIIVNIIIILWMFKIEKSHDS